MDFILSKLIVRDKRERLYRKDGIVLQDVQENNIIKMFYIYYNA